MPSVFTHAAIPLALWCASERGRISGRLLGAGVVAAVLPDADVLLAELEEEYRLVENEMSLLLIQAQATKGR